MIALHGDIQRNKCFANCQGDPTYIDISTLTWDEEAGPPRLPALRRLRATGSGMVRRKCCPPANWERAMYLSRVADVMLVVGTSGEVQPAASLPFLARESGVLIVEVNPAITPITRIAHWRLAGPSAVILPQVVAALAGDEDRD